MNNEIDIVDFKLSILSLWKRKAFILVVTLLTTLIGLLYTYNQVPINTYSARATVYSAVYGSYQESITGSTAIVTYADIVTSNKVCERAASILSDATITSMDISDMISASVNNDSAIMGIYAYSSNPELSIKVVNAVAEAFVIEIQRITGSDAIQVLDSANTYYLYSSGTKDLFMKRALFVAIGFVLSCGIVMLRELFSGKVKSIEQCKGENDTIIGVIPHI